jgi:hypothetical protein
MIGVLSRNRLRAILRTAMGPDIALALADPRFVEVMVKPDGVLRLPARRGPRRHWRSH